jgi:hypothetical protein
MPHDIKFCHYCCHENLVLQIKKSLFKMRNYTFCKNLSENVFARKNCFQNDNFTAEIKKSSFLTKTLCTFYSIVVVVVAVVVVSVAVSRKYGPETCFKQN